MNAQEFLDKYKGKKIVCPGNIMAPRWFMPFKMNDDEHDTVDGIFFNGETKETNVLWLGGSWAPDKWMRIEDVKHLRVESIRETLDFRADYIKIGCRELSLEDAHVLHQALGEWLEDPAL